MKDIKIEDKIHEINKLNDVERMVPSKKNVVVNLALDGNILNSTQTDELSKNLIQIIGKMCLGPVNKCLLSIGSSEADQVLHADIDKLMQVALSFKEAWREAGGQSVVDIEPVLLADALQDLPAGATFNQVLNGSQPNVHAGIFDHSQFLSLYLQIHKLALENPDAKIHHIFFDRDEERLKTLQTLFVTYPYLLPSDAVLIFYQTNAHVKELLAFGQVIGEGEADRFALSVLYRLAYKTVEAAWQEGTTDVDSVDTSKQDKYKKSLSRINTARYLMDVLDKVPDSSESFRKLLLPNEISQAFKLFMQPHVGSDWQNLMLVVSPIEKNRIQAFSFDVDGCLFNENFYIKIRKLYMLNNDQFKSIIKQIRNTEEALRAEKSQSATLMECFQENQHEKLQAQLKSLFLRLTALENGLLREALQATNQSLIEHVRLMMDTFDEKLMGSLKFKKTLNKIIEKDSAYFGRSDQPLSAEGLKLDQKKALKEMKKTIFLVGSSRQSASTNNCNKRVRIPSLESMNGKKYVFQVDCAFAALKNLKKLFSEDNIELNRMLLPDCFNGLPLGATFARTRGLNCSEKNDLPVFDQNKVLIIYAQAHELAARHPNHLICLSLFDDREDILKALGDFLAKTPTMLPKNVKLALIQYNGKSSPTLRYVIQGTGCIDVAYSKTLLNMATQAMFALPLEKRRRGGTVDVTQLDPRLLGNFREPMTMKAFPFCKPTKEDVDRQLSTQSAPMFFTRGFKNQPEVDVMNTEVIGSKR